MTAHLRYLTLLVFSVSLMLGSGCEKDNSDSGGGSGGSHITLDEYHAISARMSYDDVINILGRKADQDTYYPSTGSAYAAVNNRFWYNSDGTFVAVYFDANDSVFEKHCGGLKDASGANVYLVDGFYVP